jgi:hypothetical protein
MSKKLLVFLVGFALTTPAFAAGPPAGFEIIEVTNDVEFWDSFPELNNCGQIVFSKRMGNSWSQSEIFFYENGALVQLTENSDRDVWAVMNNLGDIVWLRGIGSAGAHQVILYQEGETTVLADSLTGLGGGLDLNDLGHVTWAEDNDDGCLETEHRVLFFDGTDSFTISEGGGSHQSMQLNNSDEIVWTNYQFCVNPWDSDILFTSGAAPVPVSANHFEVQIPRINDLSQVVWQGPDGIQLWHPPGVLPESDDDGFYGSITTITTDGASPSINNHSDISFGRLREDTQTGQLWLYRAGQFHQITDDPLNSHKVSFLNDWGEMAWQRGTFPIGDVMFMRRIRNGEADFNGFIDRQDHAALVSCLTGPTETDGLCDCRFLDIDHDRDVDLADFALFQQNFGWQAPPDLKHPPGTGQQP